MEDRIKTTKTLSSLMVFALLTFAPISFPAAASPYADDIPEAGPVTLELAHAVTEDRFHKAARRAYSRRHWTVTDVQGNLVRAALERRGITYKADMELKSNIVEIRFLTGFGDTRQNYLNNLRRDLEFELSGD